MKSKIVFLMCMFSSVVQPSDISSVCGISGEVDSVDYTSIKSNRFLAYRKRCNELYQELSQCCVPNFGQISVESLLHGDSLVQKWQKKTIKLGYLELKSHASLFVGQNLQTWQDLRSQIAIIHKCHHRLHDLYKDLAIKKSLCKSNYPNIKCISENVCQYFPEEMKKINKYEQRKAQAYYNAFLETNRLRTSFIGR